MIKFFEKIVELVTGEPPAKVAFNGLTKRDLIRMESKIGAQIFGPVIAGHRREFFCLDDHTWIWYEEWIDPVTKKKQSVTTRYEIHDKGILKVQDGHPYHHVDGDELKNLINAIELYYERVVRHIYKHDPVTSQPLTHSVTINR